MEMDLFAIPILIFIEIGGGGCDGGALGPFQWDAHEAFGDDEDENRFHIRNCFWFETSSFLFFGVIIKCVEGWM